MGKKETWFERNLKAVAFITGTLLILAAIGLYVFAPTRAGSEASGQGFTMPFVIVLTVIGALVMPSPMHSLLKAIFTKREEPKPNAGGQ